MTTEEKLVADINAEWKAFKDVLLNQAKEETAKFGKALGDTDAKLDLIGTKLNALELKLQRPAAEAKSILVPDEIASTEGQRKAYMKMLRKGTDRLSSDERKLVDEVKALVVTDDTTGGFGAPAEFSAEIIKGVVQISPMRSLVRVRQTGMRSVKIMKRTGTFAAVWTGGGGTGTKSETVGLTYGLEEIPTHEIYALVDVANQDLEDVQFNLEGELSQEFTEQFALAEGVAVISGSGSGRPEGILTNADIAADITADANLITYDGLVDVSHNGKAEYLPGSRFLFNLKTLGKIRKLVDGNGDPLWAPMAPGAPATILGFPYSVIPGMPDVAAQAYPVAFGDFNRAYQLVDRVALTISRDPFTQATSGAVRFIARKRLGGQVVLVEAFRKLKVSAS